VICPAEWIFPLPDSLSMPEGAMMEPLAVGIFAADLAQLRGGEACAVVGCGAIGLSALQALKAAGAARVAVEDPIEGRVALARELGAEEAPPIPHDSDVVAECAGTPEALSRALELARPGGQVLVVGIPDEDALVFSASLARRKGLTLKFARRYKHCFPRAIQRTAEGRIRVSPYLTHRFPLERAREAFDLAASRADGAVRVWINLTQTGE
jgi:L-iditol 2-dehydrogenase